MVKLQIVKGLSLGRGRVQFHSLGEMAPVSPDGDEVFTVADGEGYRYIAVPANSHRKAELLASAQKALAGLRLLGI